jgi:hypothetical protein
MTLGNLCPDWLRVSISKRKLQFIAKESKNALEKFLVLYIIQDYEKFCRLGTWK